MLNLWQPWHIEPWLFLTLGMLVGVVWICGVTAWGLSQVRQWEPQACPSRQFFKSHASWCSKLLGLIAGMGLAIASYWQFGANAAMLIGLLFAGTLLALGWIDWSTGYLPDVLTQPLLWLGLLVNLNDGFVPLPQAVLGAVVGYAGFWIVAWLFLRVTGRAGLGHGDFKLLAAMGAWLGVTALPLLLLVASASALVMALLWRLGGKLQTGQTISFGPFLALAGLWYLLWPHGVV